LRFPRMKKRTHNKSLRLSISKNWTIIKKKYLNRNVYSTESNLTNSVFDSFLYELNFKNERIIWKKFSNKFVILIHVLPSYKINNNNKMSPKLNWIMKCVTRITNLPIFLTIKNINSPFLGAKILNKVFNDQIRVGNLKSGFKRLEKNSFTLSKFHTKGPRFYELFFNIRLVLSCIKKIKTLRNFKLRGSRNQKINSFYKLKNKIFFQKLFLKLRYLPTHSLTLRLLVFCVYLNPNYTNMTIFFFNWWQTLKITNKHSNGIKGWTLIFHGKYGKTPRKLKMKLQRGSTNHLKIKTNLKANFNNYFISNKGISNVKFFINY